MPVVFRTGSFFFFGVDACEFFIGQLHEDAGGTFPFSGNALPALLVIEFFVAFGAFHFPPEEDAHYGCHGGAVLDIFKQGIEFRSRHANNREGIG